MLRVSVPIAMSKLQKGGSRDRPRRQILLRVVHKSADLFHRSIPRGLTQKREPGARSQEPGGKNDDPRPGS
jgi:hypothetical protein